MSRTRSPLTVKSRVRTRCVDDDLTGTTPEHGMGDSGASDWNLHEDAHPVNPSQSLSPLANESSTWSRHRRVRTTHRGSNCANSTYGAAANGMAPPSPDTLPHRSLGQPRPVERAPTRLECGSIVPCACCLDGLFGPMRMNLEGRLHALGCEGPTIVGRRPALRDGDRGIAGAKAHKIRAPQPLGTPPHPGPRGRSDRRLNWPNPTGVRVVRSLRPLPSRILRSKANEMRWQR